MVLDISANIVPLTVKSTLAIISFIALDTNGSILVAGVFEKAMNDHSAFRSSIDRNGMYISLINLLLEVAKEHGSTVLGSSKIPRYNYPNDRKPMSFKASKEFMKAALDLCTNLQKKVTFVDKADFKNFKDFHSSLPKGCIASQYKQDYINQNCKSFLEDIASAVGNGVGHILTYTFF